MDKKTKAERLLIIGGTGRDAGKSSLAALLISRFADRGVNGIKITPHDHPDVSGLTLINGNDIFQVYEEKKLASDKDSARMLKAGALKVFLIVSPEAHLGEAFSLLQPLIIPGVPVICESPALRRYVEPDLFILMMHSPGNSVKRKNIDDLIGLSDLNLSFHDLQQGKADIIDLDTDNRWYLKK